MIDSGDRSAAAVVAADLVRFVDQLCELPLPGSAAELAGLTEELEVHQGNYDDWLLHEPDAAEFASLVRTSLARAWAYRDEAMRSLAVLTQCREHLRARWDGLRVGRVPDETLEVVGLLRRYHFGVGVEMLTFIEQHSRWSRWVAPSTRHVLVLPRWARQALEDFGWSCGFVWSAPQVYRPELDAVYEVASVLWFEADEVAAGDVAAPGSAPGSVFGCFDAAVCAASALSR